MKPNCYKFLLVVALSLSILFVGESRAGTVNELIQQGHYQAAINQIVKEEGANSPKLAKLRKWVTQESPRNLRKSDKDDVAPEQAKAALEARKKLEKWVGNYEINPLGIAKPGSSSGNLRITIGTENGLIISGNASYIVEWPGIVATHSFNVNATVAIDESGTVKLPGDYSCSHDFQQGYVDKETGEAYRVHSTGIATLYTAENFPTKVQDAHPDELFLPVYTGGSYQRDSMYRFVKVK